MSPPSLERECKGRKQSLGMEIPNSEFNALSSASRALCPDLCVAHVLRKFDPAEWGGTETAIQRLIEGLQEHQIRSVLFCPQLQTPPAREILSGNGCVIKRFRAFLPVWGIRPERRRQMLAVGGNLLSFDLPLALWRERDLALIHTHTLGRLGGAAAAIARIRRLPLVVSIHGGLLDLPAGVKNGFAEAGHNGFEWGKLFGFILQSRRVLEHADAILTCNPTEARLLREKYPGKRIQVQPHGIPVADYEKNYRGAALEAFPQIRDRQVLLCVGRIDPVKNQAWLAAQALVICRKHPGVLFVFTGACTDENYGSRLRKQVREFNLKKKVLFTGGLPPGDARLIGLFQEAQAVVLPSISETFGLVILEAWAAGAAVISSRTSGATALVEHGENGWLFDLEKSETFHSAVDATLANPNLQKQLAKAGKKLAATFSISAVARRVKTLYAELTKEKHALRHFAR